MSKKKLNSDEINKSTFSVNKKTRKEGHDVQALANSTRITPPEPDCGILKNGIKHYPTPDKFPTDKKQYSVIRLHNGLTALLVSYEQESESNVCDSEYDLRYLDSSISCLTSESNEESDPLLEIPPSRNVQNAKIAACCLTIGVGSFSDPENLPGLAHLLEHVVYMGTRKYPKETKFDDYIYSNMGTEGATTHVEFTDFYFACLEKFMPKSLDIFSEIFISPLLKKETIRREIEVLDTEYKHVLSCEYNRRDQVLATTFAEGNPGVKFAWGNLKSLKSDVINKYLFSTLFKFRKIHYTADRMTLAIQAPADLETLQSWAVKYFSGIRSNPLPLPSVPASTVLFQEDKFHKMYYVKSKCNITTLELNWQLPPLQNLYESKSTNYFKWLLCHRAKGSLFSNLMEKKLVLNINVPKNNPGFRNNSFYYIFTIRIVLTEDGYRKLNDVIAMVFSYIKMLRLYGHDVKVFQDFQYITTITSQYKIESNPLKNVRRFSHNMLYYPIKEYITGGKLLFDYKPLELNKFLNYLTQSSVNIMISRKVHDSTVILDVVEKWFKVEYGCVDIPAEWSKRWETIERFSEFSLPEPNKYITTDFSLMQLNKFSLYPENIHSSNNLSIWYKPDTKFGPVGFIGFQIVNKEVFESILENTMLSLYTDILKQILEEELSAAKVVSLECSIRVSNRALLVQVYGFNQNLHILIEKIVESIKKFNKVINEEILHASKESNRRELYNNNLEITTLGHEILWSILLNIYFSSAEKYNIIPLITLELIKQFSINFFKKAYIQCLVQGNIQKMNALSICKKFVTELNTEGLSEQERPKLFVHELPNYENCCRIKSINLSDSKCLTINYYQLGPGNLRDYCAMQLLEMLIKNPLFYQLNKIERLSSNISICADEQYGVLGFTVTVVSNAYQHPIGHVEERITYFLRKFLKYLKELGQPEFKEAVKTIINFKLHSDSDLKEEVARNWTEIKCFEYTFDILKREADILPTLTCRDLTKFLERCITPGQPYFKKLTTQIVGNLTGGKKNISPEMPAYLEYTYVTDEDDSHTIYKECYIKSINRFKTKLRVHQKSKIF